MASSKVKTAAETADKQHKNKFVYIGTVVILVITVIAFVVVPAMGGAGDGGPDTTLGYWKGTPISFVQNGYFANQVQQIKTQYEQQGYKDSGDPEFARVVWQRAFENTAIHFALLDYAKKEGIAISEDAIDEEIKKSSAFMENGVFSKRRYRETSNTYKLELRNNVATTAIKNAYISDSTAYETSKAELEFIKNIASERRVIQYTSFPFSDYPKAEVIRYVNEHPADFKRISLSQLSISASKKEAEQIAAQITSGALSFEDAAKNHSKDGYAANGGTVGWRYAWELKNELKNTADVDGILTLNKDALSPVYETLTGTWVFFRINEEAKDSDSNFDETEKSARNYILRYERGRVETWAMAEAAAFAASADKGFEKAAVEQGKTVQTSKAFPLNYGSAFTLGGYFSMLGTIDTQNLPELFGADTNEAFLSAVFNAKVPSVLAPMVMQNTVIVPYVKETQQADEAELKQIDTYYSMLGQQDVSQNLAAAILKSPSLKNNFDTVFAKLFGQRGN